MVGGGGEVVLMKNSVHDLGLLWDVTALLYQGNRWMLTNTIT